MPDVVETAQKRRQKLQAEIAKLDDFLSYAQKLIEENGQAVEPRSAGADAHPATSDAPDSKSPSAPASQGPSTPTASEQGAPVNDRSSFFQKSSPASG